MMVLKAFTLGILIGLLALLVFIILKKRRFEKTEYFLQTKTPYFSVLRNKGLFGEYSTFQYLAELQGAKHYLFNLYLPKDNGETTEIDVVLLHESGIYVFESKNYSGWIFGTETQPYWTQTLSNGKGPAHKTRFFNPIMQNKVHLKWLQNFLADDTLPLYSYIVFSDRCTLKDITLTSGEHTVVNRYDLLSAVQQNAAKAGVRLSSEKLDALYKKLYPLTQTDAAKKVLHAESIQQKYRDPSIQPTPINEEGLNVETPAVAEKDALHPAPAKTETADAKDNVPPPLPAEAGDMCPRCGGNLILRTATKGPHRGKKFLGCSNFPKCRYTKDMPEA